MPRVSINVMHEVVYGCVQLVSSIDKGDGKVGGATYSWRLQWRRARLHQDWLMVRMNSPGWGQEGDRLEILWGPGYGDRYDYLVFEGGRIRSFFAPLSHGDKVEIAIIDKRRELESFDPEARHQDTETRHLMY